MERLNIRAIITYISIIALLYIGKNLIFIIPLILLIVMIQDHRYMYEKFVIENIKKHIQVHDIGKNTQIHERFNIPRDRKLLYGEINNCEVFIENNIRHKHSREQKIHIILPNDIVLPKIKIISARELNIQTRVDADYFSNDFINTCRCIL